MNRFGLLKKDCEVINSIFRSFKEIESVLIFGSRAMGTYKKGSDIDLALKGPHVSKILYQVKSKLEQETTLPYMFDLVCFEDIKSSPLLDHINQFGVEIYNYDNYKKELFTDET